jgi:hypothetical protein
MKIVKLTMLVATAAIAATAFIGVSSASATPPWIAICGKPQLLNCEGKWLVKHPLLGRIILLAGQSIFNIGFVKVNCASGEGHSNEIESEQKGEFKGTLESFPFASCTGCTGVVVKMPQAMVLDMETETGGWRLKANGVKVKFNSCPLSQSCTYEGNLNLEVQMNETGAFVEPKSTTVNKVAGESSALCAEIGRWETGTMSFDWELDDQAFPFGERHRNITLSLIGANLIQRLNGLGEVG